MSEIKPVYQSQTGGVWHDVTDKEYAFRRELSGVYQTRILYPAEAYEALQKENAELKEQIYLISQKLVASESLYKAYKEDSKRMYRNSCKSYQEKIENLEKKIHELESPAKHEAGQRCNHYKCDKCFNQSPQIISKESWDNACNGLGGNRG